MKKIIMSITIIILISLIGYNIYSHYNSSLNKTDEISDDLYSGEILIDGVKYTLPLKYNDLKKDGWKFTNESELMKESLKSSDYQTFSLENGNHTLNASILNFEMFFSTVVLVQFTILKLIILTSRVGQVLYYPKI